MKDRREILKGMAIGSTWATPLVSSVMLPAHAQTSVPTQPTGQFLLTFTASNFSFFFGDDNPVPVPVVSGEVIYQTAAITDDLTAPIDSLISIDLTINGAAYEIADVAFAIPGNLFIGGVASGAAPIFLGTDDFALVISPESKEFLTLGYSTSGTDTVWQTEMGSTTVTPILA